MYQAYHGNKIIQEQNWKGYKNWNKHNITEEKYVELKETVKLVSELGLIWSETSQISHKTQ